MREIRKNGMPWLITITLLACILIVYLLAGFIRQLIWFDGITLRVFSKNVTNKTRAEVLLEYQPTFYIPFISAWYRISLFGGDYWDEIPREIVKKPARITDTFTEYRIKTSLKYPGGYVLKGITIQYNTYSFRITEGDYKADYNAKLIGRMRYNYTHDLPSFALTDHDANTDKYPAARGKVPIRTEHEIDRYPHGAIDLPVAFNNLEVIDHYYFKTYEEYNNRNFTTFFTTPDVITGRVHQVVLKEPPVVKQDKNGKWSVTLPDLDLEEKPIKGNDKK